MLGRCISTANTTFNPAANMRQGITIGITHEGKQELVSFVDTPIEVQNAALNARLGKPDPRFKEVALYIIDRGTRLKAGTFTKPAVQTVQPVSVAAEAEPTYLARKSKKG